MERITYRITLDAYKNGIQRTLQGFETGDNVSRRLAINLVSGGDTFEIAQDVIAMIYVHNGSVPSINACEIVDNTIIYDVLPITEEGIFEMQVKLIEVGINGAQKVLVAPKFAVEVSESGTGDGGATGTTTFTALENALAKAEAVYNSRIIGVEIDDDCTFKVMYADGTVYENDYLKEALYNGNALLSESFAHGNTGIREGENTDNAKYYSNVSKSASEDAKIVSDEARDMLDEARLQTSFTSFGVDFTTGELVYMSANYTFDINEDNGNLEATNDGSYDPEAIVGSVVNDFIEMKSVEIDEDIKSLETRATEMKEASERIEEKTSENTEDIGELGNKVDLLQKNVNENLARSFQNRGRADGKNIDDLMNNENQGQWWVEVSKVQGTHAFDSGYYYLICYSNVQVAIRFASSDTAHRPIKYRYYTNNKWYGWSSDKSSNPNLLINGDFQVWQRGTSFDLQTNGAYKYTADRWCVATSNSHHIEKGSSGGITLACSLYQHLENPLNQGHEYVLSANIGGTVHTLSIVGGTSASNDYLKYVVSSSKETVQIVANSNGQTIKWVKLEKGAIATPFIPRLYAEEFTLCMRYYQRVFGVGLAYLFIWPSSYNVALTSFNFSPMRATPTVTLHACWGTDSNGNGVMCNSIEVTDVAYDFVNMKLTFDSSINSARGCIGQFKLDAEIY